MRVSGNTVLITGGGSGIGLAIAKAFARADSQVIVCGRDEDKLAAASREAPQIEAKQCDLTSRADREELVAWTENRFPALNMLVNNAGVASLVDLTAETFDFERVEHELIADFYAPVDLTLRLLPRLRRQHSAALVNVSTGQIYSPAAGWPVYSSAKTALHTWTQAARFQLRDTAIKVFEVMPPIVNTNMLKSLGVEPPGAISADKVADAVLAGIAKNRKEIRVGQTKGLYVASRIAPEWIYRTLNRRIERMQPASPARIRH